MMGTLFGRDMPISYLTNVWGAELPLFIQVATLIVENEQFFIERQKRPYK